MKTFALQRNRVAVIAVKLTGPHGEKWTHAILDTGATYSMFPPAVIKAVGCTSVTTSNTVKIITASSVEYVPTLQIPSIEVFGYVVKNIQIVSHLLPPGTPAQGLIGINVLQNFDLEFKFSREILIVKKQSEGL